MLKLYSYFRSSAAYRCRIALNLKGLAHETTFVHLLKDGGQHTAATYRALNPQALVPTLEHDGKVITQSLAIIEYLDETFPEPSLLPGNAEERAKIKAFALAIACDIHPLQNLRVLNYLRGPLGRDEIKKLTAGQKASIASSSGKGQSAASAPLVPASSSGSRPMVAPDVPQYFSPDAAAAVSSPLRPVVYGAVNARFVDPKLKLDVMKLVTLAATINEGPVAVDWEHAERVDWAPEMLERDAPDGAAFAEIPGAAAKAKSYDAWTKQLLATLVAHETIELMRSPSTDELSRPDESERDFRARLQQASRESRDRALETLRRKYGPRQAALVEKRRRAQQTVERESQQATGQKLQTAISVGATLMGALFGRKSMSASTLGRATTAVRGVGRSMKESEDISRANETVFAIDEQSRQLEDELRTETATIETAGDAASETLERISVKPKKTNLTVKLVALVWTK